MISGYMLCALDCTMSISLLLVVPSEVLKCPSIPPIGGRGPEIFYLPPMQTPTTDNPLKSPPTFIISHTV